MDNVWAIKAGSSGDNTVWNTGAQPTIADTVYSNGFAILVNNNLQFAKISNAANAGIGVSAGGSFTLTQDYSCVGGIEKTGTVATIITAGFGLNYTGGLDVSGGTGTGAIQVTGNTNSSSLVLNITGFTSSGNVPGIVLANTQNTCDVTINMSPLTLPALLVSVMTNNPNMNIYINGTHQQSTAGYCTNVSNSQKFHLNGVVHAGSVALLSGITGTNYATVDAINLENMTVFPIAGSGSSIIKFNASGTNYVRANFSDSTVKNMSLVSDLPDENKVIYPTRYDFDLKEGKYKELPEELASKNATYGVNKVGQAILTIITE